MSDKINEVRYEGPVYFRGGRSELRHTPAGDAVCEARMRVSKKFGDEWETVFFTVSAWDDAAVTLSKVGHKEEVIVTGRWTLSKPYTTRDGTVVGPEMAVAAKEVEKVGSFEPSAPATVTYESASDVPF